MLSEYAITLGKSGNGNAATLSPRIIKAWQAPGFLSAAPKHAAEELASTAKGCEETRDTPMVKRAKIEIPAGNRSYPSKIIGLYGHTTS